MGLSGKPQVDGGLESERQKWVLAGVSLRAPLKPIYTNPVEKDMESDDDQGDESRSTTPRGEEAKIPTILTCPPAPRKRKPSLKFNYGSVREFFTPPDLESVFKSHVDSSTKLGGNCLKA